MIQVFLALSLFLAQAGTFEIVSVNIRTESVEFLLPPGFTPSFSGSADGPVTLTNFNDQYVNGGIIPPDGVKMTISTWKKTGTLRDLISRDTENKVFTESVVNLTDRNGTKVVTVDSSPEIRLTTATVYVEGKEVFYKIFLTYHTYNPKAEAYEEFFKGFLYSIKFLK